VNVFAVDNAGSTCIELYQTDLRRLGIEGGVSAHWEVPELIELANESVEGQSEG